MFIEHLGRGLCLLVTFKASSLSRDTISYARGLHWSQTMSLFDFHSSTLLYRVISIICQTLVYGQSPFSSQSPSRSHGTLTPPFMAHKGIYSCLFPVAVFVMLYGSLGLSPPSPMLFSRRFVTKQVEETLQPNADGALRDNGDHVRAVDHILDLVRRCHLSGLQGVVQRARSCDSLSTNLAANATCHSSCQRQLKHYFNSIHHRVT